MSDTAKFGAHLRAFATSGAVATILIATLDAAGARSAGALSIVNLPAIAAYLCGVYGVIAILPVLLGAATTRFVPEVQQLTKPTVLVTLFGGLTSSIAVGYMVVLWTRRLFQNIELSALLAAAVMAAVFVLFGALGMVSLRIGREDPRAKKASAFGWTLLGVAAAGWLVHQNRTGFAQLPIPLLVMPGALIALALIGIVQRRRLVALDPLFALIPLGVMAVGMGAAAGFEIAGARTPDYVSEFAPLGSWLAQPLHAATDFDGDGFSGLMGGGDCAPFDASIAPGKLDVPGDGIDNNCVGGDASKNVETQKPDWFDLPDNWPDYNVLLLTVETLRADHVGFNGYKRDTTPNLDELAKTSLVFERFYATSTFTRLAIPSLLTGRTPSHIDWEKQDDKKKKFPRIAESNPWLSSAFSEAGFDTAAITANFPAFTERDSIGFGRGFDDFDPKTKLTYKGGTMRGFPSKDQTKKAKKWLTERDPQKRSMLWIHFFEPHYLYQQFPKAPKFGKGRQAKYDSEIWGVDQAIGQILQHLKDSGRFDDTIIIVLGDHGEEFDEHGKKYHGSNLYDPQTRTPLLIHVPDGKGLRVRAPASFIDLAPTLLNLAKVRVGFDDFEGRNLTPLLFGKGVSERPFFLEVWNVKTRANYKVAVVNWPYKMLASGANGKNQELYNLSKDPDESKDLRADLPDVAKAMEEALHGYLDSTSLEYRAPPKQEQEQEQKR